METPERPQQPTPEGDAEAREKSMTRRKFFGSLKALAVTAAGTVAIEGTGARPAIEEFLRDAEGIDDSSPDFEQTMIEVLSAHSEILRELQAASRSRLSDIINTADTALDSFTAYSQVSQEGTLDDMYAAIKDMDESARILKILTELDANMAENKSQSEELAAIREENAELRAKVEQLETKAEMMDTKLDAILAAVSK